MPNAIKYSTSAQTLALKKGNYWIGTGDVGKGPTSTTDYWNGITPPSGGYTIYLNKASNGPAIYTAANDSQLISLSNTISGQTFATAAAALDWYNGQTDKVVFNADYESIVTDGLVLNLDAGFTPSYPTTGTSWYDLGPNSNTSSLVNGPTFSSSQGGIINMDGSNDYCDVPYQTWLDLPNARTTSFWVKLNNKTNFQSMLGQANPGAGQRKWDVRYGAASGSDNKIRVVLGQGGPQMNCDSTSTWDLTTQWYNIAVTYDGSVTTCTIYVNGSQAGQITNAFSSLYSSVANGVTTPNINVGTRAGANYTNGSYGNVFVYSRALTAAEVLQNYNAQKSRFGL